MGTGRAHDFPAGLESTRRRFDHWRQTRDGRSRIPEALWAWAVKAVGRYGLNPTARTLRLDYYSLKKRAEATRREVLFEPEPQSRGSGGGTGSRRGPDRLVSAKARAVAGETVAEFIELAPPVAGSSVECILELEDPRGAKMRVQLKGAPVPDLAALSRSFWSIER